MYMIDKMANFVISCTKGVYMYTDSLTNEIIIKESGRTYFNLLEYQ